MPQRNQLIATYKRLFLYVKPHKLIFTGGLISMAIIAMTEAALPALLKPILDGTFVEKDPFFLQWAPFALAALFLIRGIATLLSSAAFSSISTKIMHALRMEMFGNLLHLPDSFFSQTTGGKIISKFTYDVTQISNASVEVLNALVKDTLIVLGLIGYIIWLDWKLSLLILLMLPATAVIAKYIGTRQKILSSKLQNSFGDMTHIIEEVFKGIRVIKLFNGFKKESDRFNLNAKAVRSQQFKMNLSAKIGVPIVEFIGAIIMGLAIYLGTQNSSAEPMTVGSFVAFFTALGLLFSPIKRLTKLTHPISLGYAACESVFALIDEAKEKNNGKVILNLDRPPSIMFDHLSFSYQAHREPALKNISFEIKSASTVALVGKSGCGKSTLTSLIPKFISPLEGCLFINGKNINDLETTSLREHIALVSQDVILFNDTIAANISYGSVVTNDEIKNAATLAHAMEFIDKLPDGLNTQLGENGGNLSGGQRQRIALARALIKNAKIIILDEATSALDIESEKEINNAIQDLHGDATIIIVAHKLDAIRSSDQIFVFSKGELIEQGTHQLLMESGKEYAAFFKAAKE